MIERAEAQSILKEYRSLCKSLRIMQSFSLIFFFFPKEMPLIVNKWARWVAFWCRKNSNAAQVMAYLWCYAVEFGGIKEKYMYLCIHVVTQIMECVWCFDANICFLLGFFFFLFHLNSADYPAQQGDLFAYI